MNLLPTYEELIAERLEGITIPDMADATWVRIETALDVELPVNEPPATPANPFFNNPTVWLISAGILAIIISIFLLLRNWDTAPKLPRDLPKRSAPAVQPDTTLQQDYKPPPDKPRPAPRKTITPVIEKPVADTLLHTPIINKVPTDTLLKIPPVITAPPPGTTKPVIEVKPRKKYGIEVSDSDYKFNVKPKS
ncbi:hypothetical protein A4D02_33895 [Niastella koreensis]|uniref:Uncharacterized protein n=1 Tax=Niastella koreensis TaxID=354356 RepID=A0ABX3NTN7_9BACT|nr:hypothetical protein [Niastella koreensis]OQP45390.1 hypothetical protein A4D02_33895 [Niastella koreensis]